jgi:hypothetical protein
LFAILLANTGTTAEFEAMVELGRQSSSHQRAIHPLLERRRLVETEPR